MAELGKQSDNERKTFHDLLGDVLVGKLNRRQVVARATALGLSAASVGTLAAAAAPSAPAKLVPANAQDAEPVAGGRLIAGVLGDPANLDPHKESLTAKFHVLEHIYEGLVRELPSLEIEPLLAAEMPVISEDGLTYTFTLRTDAMFHAPVSRAVTAADVKFSYERILDPETASGSTSLLASLATVEAPDEQTVVITLKAPDASFLASLSGRGAAIVAPEVVEENDGLDTVAVGTGPFTFVEYVPNTRVLLAKNPDYREEGKPYLDEIELIPIPNDQQRTTAVQTNTVDFIEYAPLRDIETLEGDSNLMMAGDANTNIRFLAINFEREPLGDPRVRRAIALALDRSEILVPATFGYGIATETIFPPGYWAHVEGPGTERNVEEARALLAEAGYPDGFELEILSWSAYEFLSQPSYVVQEQLSEIGITAEVVLEENAVFIERLLATKDFDVAVTGTSGYVDPNDIYGRNFRTGASGNGMNYSNPEVDELIAAGIAATDQTERAAIYEQLQAILLEDLPWINLFIASQYEAMRTDVMGYVHIPTGSNYSFKDVWLDR